MCDRTGLGLHESTIVGGFKRLLQKLKNGEVAVGRKQDSKLFRFSLLIA